MGLVVTTSLFGCAHHDAAVSAATAQSARAVGAQLAAADRERALQLRTQLAKVVRVDGVRVTEDDRWMRIVFAVHNLSKKTMARFDVALEVTNAGDGSRIATTELHQTTAIAPGATVIIDRRFPYTQFGDDTGPMREAVGKPQRQSAYVKWIKYTDGSEAGDDD